MIRSIERGRRAWPTRVYFLERSSAPIAPVHHQAKIESNRCPKSAKKLSDTILKVSLIIIVPAVISSLIRIPTIGFKPIMALQSATIPIVLALYLFRGKLSFHPGSVIFVSWVLALAMVGPLNFGLVRGGKMFLLALAPPYQRLHHRQERRAHDPWGRDDGHERHGDPCLDGRHPVGFRRLEAPDVCLIADRPDHRRGDHHCRRHPHHIPDPQLP